MIDAGGSDCAGEGNKIDSLDFFDAGCSGFHSGATRLIEFPSQYTLQTNCEKSDIGSVVIGEAE